MPITYLPIASQTLTSSAASVTLSSIPQTYTDLVLRASTGDSATLSVIRVRFNGSAATTYSFTRMEGDGASGLSARASNQTQLDVRQNSFPPMFSSLELYVPNYRAATNKPTSSFTVQERDFSLAYIQALAGLWRNTAAITEIGLSLASGSFAAGSTFHLYGISNT